MTAPIHRWKVEVAKMVFYVFFPILTYTYYSNPAIFEEAVVKEAHKLPKVDFDDVDQLEQLKEQKRRESFEALKRKFN